MKRVDTNGIYSRQRQPEGTMYILCKYEYAIYVCTRLGGDSPTNTPPLIKT